MNIVTRITTTALLGLGLAGGALAQAPAPAGADHGAHHPPAAAAPQAPAPSSGGGNPGQGGMMGGMMSGEMGRMMHHRMMHGAMQPFRRIEGQLAFFRAELRITEAQTAPWNAFADAVRTQSERLRTTMQQAMAASPGPLPAPQQMERRMALLTAHLEAMRAVSTAAGPLYAALSEEQRRLADELMAEHLRGMRMSMGAM